MLEVCYREIKAPHFVVIVLKCSAVGLTSAHKVAIAVGHVFKSLQDFVWNGVGFWS